MDRSAFLQSAQNSGGGQSNKVTNHVYTNVQINNTKNEPILAEYAVEQNQPILSHQEDFQARVVRFKIPMAEVPLFIWEPRQYYISICIVEEDNTRPLNDPLRVQHTSVLPALEVRANYMIAQFHELKDKIQGYRQGVYHVNDFLRDLNRALRRLWDNALIFPIYQDIIGDRIQNEYPRLNFSTAQNRFYFELPLRRDVGPGGESVYQTIFYPGRYDNDLVDPSTRRSIRVLMSSQLYSLFNGFPAYQFGPRGVNVGNVYIPELSHGLSLHHNRESTCIQSNILYGYGEPLLANGVPNADALLPYPYQCVYQEQSSLFAWNRATRILLGSSMGFVKETAIFNDGSGVPKTFEVLTDFAVQQSSIDSPREYIYYADQGGNRYIDTKATGVLSRVDIKIFIEYDNGFRIPLFIAPRQEVNIKLAFDRKPHNELVQISDASRHTFEN